jgi:hypothetical protein
MAIDRGDSTKSYLTYIITLFLKEMEESWKAKASQNLVSFRFVSV